MEERKKYKYLTKTFTMPNGKRAYIRAKTQEELEQKVFEARFQMSMGVDITDRTTVADLAQLWYDVCKKPHLKDSSLARLRNVLDLHILPAIGALPVRKVRSAHILNMMNNYGTQAKAANRIMVQVTRNIFSFAVDNGLIAKSPVPEMLVTPGEDTKKREPLTPDQARALIDGTSGTAKTFVLLVLHTGMRLGELTGLKWDMVDLDKRVIYVRRNLRVVNGGWKLYDNLKSTSAQRDLPMTPELYAELSALKQTTKSVFVLNSRDGLPLLGWDVKRIMAECELALGGVHVFPHLFRHTFATRMVESMPITQVTLKDIQYLMGHSKPDLVMQLYAHFDKATRQNGLSSAVATAVAG